MAIASCVAAVGMFLAFLAATLYFRVVFGSETKPWFSSQGLNLFLIVVQMGLPVPVHLVGLLLGVVSLFFPTRKKLFPILAIVLNFGFALCGLIPWVWLALHAPGVK